MYRKVIFPVDLTHIDQLTRALQTAIDLALHYKAEICFVGVSGTAPSALARTPQEYESKLAGFADEQGKAHGLKSSAKACISHDPSIDTDKTLLAAIAELGGDLVVMQTHTPQALDYIWAGHGDTIAVHSKASVFLVR
ncbi:nucleotide-binding universal stress UspA family protein [Roseinatronobacter thiooxidans]|uniref:Nucleotide-binding universal stress UspA family protein n=1 Tax=Roseinatronobacter thiooxidans TaxID=121821 RepID=A0A2W7QI77_9RHOB|nr:universal stress protein [Roseinatronobacter thiooxidans]PZX48184.1 nucleotide-binding universal stress UspA family protein [Roseinatronobacter thiooxidans]